jgi:hypothetical protein
LTCATGVALFSSNALERELRMMRDSLELRSGRLSALALQLTFFSLLYISTWQIFEEHLRDETAPWTWIGLWVAAAAGTVLCGAGLFLSWRDLIGLARRTVRPICRALAIGIAAWVLGVVSADILRLPMRTPTLWLSGSLLGLLTDDMYVDTPGFVFGTSKFAVQVAPQCSGIEGIGLILAFTTAYLWIARGSCGSRRVRRGCAGAPRRAGAT